jgi:hypothetical protein
MANAEKLWESFDDIFANRELEIIDGKHRDDDSSW